jgi:hypothetical protein
LNRACRCKSGRAAWFDEKQQLSDIQAMAEVTTTMRNRMCITGRDYTDDDLIAPWDPARRRQRPNRLCDDPNRDDDRDDRDCEAKPPGGETKPCQP